MIVVYSKFFGKDKMFTLENNYKKCILRASYSFKCRQDNDDFRSLVYQGDVVYFLQPPVLWKITINSGNLCARQMIINFSKCKKRVFAVACVPNTHSLLVYCNDFMNNAFKVYRLGTEKKLQDKYLVYKENDMKQCHDNIVISNDGKHIAFFYGKIYRSLSWNSSIGKYEVEKTDLKGEGIMGLFISPNFKYTAIFYLALKCKIGNLSVYNTGKLSKCMGKEIYGMPSPSDAALHVTLCAPDGTKKNKLAEEIRFSQHTLLTNDGNIIVYDSDTRSLRGYSFSKWGKLYTVKKLKYIVNQMKLAIDGQSIIIATENEFRYICVVCDSYGNLRVKYDCEITGFTGKLRNFICYGSNLLSVTEKKSEDSPNNYTHDVNVYKFAKIANFFEKPLQEVCDNKDHKYTDVKIKCGI
jgi:WD40 repeat protein